MTLSFCYNAAVFNARNPFIPLQKKGCAILLLVKHFTCREMVRIVTSGDLRGKSPLVKVGRSNRTKTKPAMEVGYVIEHRKG